MSEALQSTQHRIHACFQLLTVRLVRIGNQDKNVLVQPIAIIAIQNNFDCSELITKDKVNMPPATGYTIQLADPFNETNVSLPSNMLTHYEPSHTP